MSGKSKVEKKEFVKLYVPELMQIMDGGDEKSCLLMAQLEYWFGLKPDGFYKFMTSARDEHLGYRKGDSWVEEMGMSKDKINNALKPICTHYKSFTEFKKAEDRFKGKYYCSYYHKLSHRTYYFRNHEKVNEALKSLSLESKSVIFREKHSSFSGKDTNSFSQKAEKGIPDFEDVEVVYTKNYTKDFTQEREENSHLKTEVNNQIESNQSVTENSIIGIKNEKFPDGNTSLKSSIQRQKTPFPENFELTEEMKIWAESKRPDINVQRATDKFISYNKSRVNNNWNSALEMWILNEWVETHAPSGSNRINQDEEYRKLFNDSPSYLG